MMDAHRQIEQFFTAWNTHDSAAMGAFYAQDAIMEDPTLKEPRRGRVAIVAYYAEMFGSLETPFHDLRDWAWRADRLWFEWTFGSGGNTRPREEFHGVSIQTFRDGLITHDAAFWRPDGE